MNRNSPLNKNKIKLKLMIAITKTPTKDKINKKYYSINYCTIVKNTKKIKLEKTAFILGDLRLPHQD